MGSSHQQKYVVIIDKAATKRADEIANELRALPGVEVLAESESFLDLHSDQNSVELSELEERVKELGGELHEKPEPTLMDPVPPIKIP